MLICKLLGRSTSKVLDRGLCSRIYRVQTRKSGEQGSHNTDDFASLGNVGGSGLDDEEGNLGVDPVFLPNESGQYNNSPKTRLALSIFGSMRLTQTSYRNPLR